MLYPIFILCVMLLVMLCSWLQASGTSGNPSGGGSSSGNASSSGSGLAGWAAFGAKTGPANPANSKLGSSSSGGNHKALSASSGQKPVGLSGLAGTKSGLGSSKAPGGSNGNGSSQASLKFPPPLTLGKQSLNRSSSGENQGKGSGSPSSSQVSAGGNGGSNGGGNAAAGDKGQTSQESQFNAMKRLQMVKKKAAQKKLKKWVAVLMRGREKTTEGARVNIASERQVCRERFIQRRPARYLNFFSLCEHCWTLCLVLSSEFSPIKKVSLFYHQTWLNLLF